MASTPAAMVRRSARFCWSGIAGACRDGGGHASLGGMSDSASGSFVHLHVHSSYSLSEGAIKAEKLATLAKEAGMPAVALTDSANLFGGLEFSQGCQGKGIQPIMGCQLFLSRTASDDRPEA